MRMSTNMCAAGLATVFCAVEPKAGKHFTQVTRNRKGPRVCEDAFTNREGLP